MKSNYKIKKSKLHYFLPITSNMTLDSEFTKDIQESRKDMSITNFERVINKF